MPDGPNGELGVKAKEPYGERLLANAVLSNEGLMIHATVPLSFVWSVRRASFGVATDLLRLTRDQESYQIPEFPKDCHDRDIFESEFR